MRYFLIFLFLINLSLLSDCADAKNSRTETAIVRERPGVAQQRLNTEFKPVSQRVNIKCFSGSCVVFLAKEADNIYLVLKVEKYFPTDCGDLTIVNSNKPGIKPKELDLDIVENKPGTICLDVLTLKRTFYVQKVIEGEYSILRLHHRIASPTYRAYSGEPVSIRIPVEKI